MHRIDSGGFHLASPALRKAVDYHRAGQLQEAEALYRNILESQPNHPDALHLLGGIAHQAGKHDAAVSLIRQAIQNVPDNPLYYSNLAAVFKAQGKSDEVISCCRKAVELDPNYAEAYNNMGSALLEQGKSAEAMACFRKALESDPDCSDALGNLSFQLLHSCEWKAFNELLPRLEAADQASMDKGFKSIEDPFASLMRSDDPSLNFAVAKAWASDIFRRMSPLKPYFPFEDRKSPLFSSRKIRLGYLSNDFRNHATAYLIRSLFGLHNREKFEVIAYSFGEDDRSIFRKQIAQDCDKFVDLRLLGHTESAKRIYKDRVDILVDLMGHSRNNRLEICALRPAPVQIAYLGFPGTTGADFFDYIITDKIVTPPDHAAYYSEKFVYMPHCYQINDHLRSASSKEWKNSDFGLPQTGLIFCSFNNSYKIEPLMFDRWMNILRQVPESVLWLLGGNELAEKNLRHEAENRGVKSQRLIFAKRSAPHEHLRRHRLADLMLDTRICNGHTTTTDALWSGVPVITVQGRHFPSRVSSSILTTMGLSELVTHDLEEYERLAVRLATHSDELAILKRKLEKHRLTSPLFDTPRWVSNLETAYKEIWKVFLAGEKPKIIKVKENHVSIKQKHSANKAASSENAEDCYRQGVILRQQGRSDEALSCFQKVVESMPDMAPAYIYIGNIIQAQGRSDEAIACYQRAAALQPDVPIVYNNMGNVLKDQGKIQEAINCYRKALQLEPEMPAACSNLLFQLQQTCSWQDFDALSAKLDRLTKTMLNKGLKTDEDPFVNLTRHADPELNFAVAKSWSDEISRLASHTKLRFSYPGKSVSKDKIAIAYLSKDFHNHATAHLMSSLFGLHDRNRFHVCCYSYGADDGSDYRKKIRKDCDRFIDIQYLNTVEAAKCINDDQTDILIDLKGYTHSNRLDICALRPAAIQVSYLGFPGTTGADFFDYIITDAVVTPEDHAPYYSEKFVYLPHCYQVNDYKQRISDKKWKRADFGLPEQAFVFCSFNQAYKIESRIFDVWMSLLRQIPESVLWLMPGNPIAKENLKHEARQRGVNPERLIFTDMVLKHEHLARYRLADLALDTRIYNGHTTSSDALWAGVPVITCYGSHFASRVSSSILTAAGTAETITHNLRDYESLALHLAGHPDALAAVRKKLAANRLAAPLFDTPRFVRNLEKAYQEMWNIFISGEKPRAIRVTDSEIPECDPLRSWGFVTRTDISAEYKKAVQFHQAGQLQAADAIYKKILEIQPGHSDALHYLGVIAHQNGKDADAVRLIREAIRIAPDNPYYHYNLGCILQEQRYSDEAAAYFRKVLELKPDYAEAYINLGVVFEEQEQFDEAIVCFESALKIAPNLPEAYNNIGHARHEQGRFKEAIPYFRKALNFRPDYAEAYLNMGNAFASLFDMDSAMPCFFKAVELKPHNVEAYNNLGNAFQSQARLGEALSCFHKSLEIQPDNAETYYSMGNVLMDDGRAEEAMTCYQKALQIMPGFQKALAGKAKSLMQKGEFDEAYQLVMPLIESGTKSIEVTVIYAMLAKRFRHHQEAVRLLEELLSHKSAGTAKTAQIHFVLGDLYDKLGDWDQAFHHYQTANSLKSWRFDAELHKKHIGNMIAAYSSEQKARLPRADNALQLPVFIVGMPRSGTTLAEQILASHPDVFGAGELAHIGKNARQLRLTPDTIPSPEHPATLTREVLNRFAADYSDRLRKFSHSALRVTDKMPQNFLLIGLIWQLFPKAAIIHCVRDPRDTALSIYFQNFLGSHAYSFDLKNIGEYYLQYERIMRHWKKDFGVPMLELHYEELVAEPERVSREMVAYIGLEWDEQCLRFHESRRTVTTASFQQVREPVYRASAGRWKNYEKYLSGSGVRGSGCKSVFEN